jgi:type I restriction enzyme S subunit
MPSRAANPQNIVEPPIQIDPRDWVEVRQILQRIVPKLEVWAFGSRARRTAKPYSDLDLALISPTSLLLEQLATVNDAFDTSDLAVRVDVVDWASISEAFRTIIAKDKVLIQTGH